MDTPSDSIPRHTPGAGVESDGGFPGFDSVSMVGVLTGFDPSRLDDDGLLRVMAGIQRVVAAAQSMQVKAMAGLSRRRPRTSGHPFGEFVADDIALELCMTRQAAEGRLGQAVEMTTHTPAVLRALETGALDLYRASAITDATYGLDEATAAQVATDVVGRVERRNVSEIRRIARRAVLRVAPEGAERRRDRARADRKVVLSPLDDGMAELTAFLPADQATARSARHSDMDHTIPWPKGSTTVGNLGVLCRGHHRMKHQATWQLTQDNGHPHWTSPTGRHYITEPAKYDPP